MIHALGVTSSSVGNRGGEAEPWGFSHALQVSVTAVKHGEGGADVARHKILRQRCLRSIIFVAEDSTIDIRDDVAETGQKWDGGCIS